MEYLPLAFLAGVLTVIAPCVFPLLPVIIGGSLPSGVNYRRAVVISASLIVAIITFTLLLKASTLLIAVDPIVWKLLSGGLIIIIGFFMLFPDIWEAVSAGLGFNNRSAELLNKASKRSGIWGEILIGLALGPVFTSCSPTFGLIIGIIFPQSFWEGVANTFAYALGLGIILLAVSLLGQQLVGKLRWATKPGGRLQQILAVLFILTGMMIITGLDKRLETAILTAGYYDTLNLEYTLIDNLQTN